MDLGAWRQIRARFAGHVARLVSLAITACGVLQLPACSLHIGEGDAQRGVETTYEKFLLRAEHGDAESQNIVAFMLFHGEGVPLDRGRAQMWFARAAEQGNARARRNLTLMNTAGVPQAGMFPAPASARAASSDVTPGERVYLRYCAGCHGFNGFSAYVYSPSFALGETLDKNDDELMRSLLHGKGEMPNWDDKLSRADLHEVLSFVRTLRSRYEAGISQGLREPPDYYFLFGPMKSRDPAGRGRIWGSPR